MNTGFQFDGIDLSEILEKTRSAKPADNLPAIPESTQQFSTTNFDLKGTTDFSFANIVDTPFKKSAEDLYPGFSDLTSGFQINGSPINDLLISAAGYRPRFPTSGTNGFFKHFKNNDTSSDSYYYLKRINKYQMEITNSLGEIQNILGPSDFGINIAPVYILFLLIGGGGGGGGSSWFLSGSGGAGGAISIGYVYVPLINETPNHLTIRVGHKGYRGQAANPDGSLSGQAGGISRIGYGDYYVKSNGGRGGRSEGSRIATGGTREKNALVEYIDEIFGVNGGDGGDIGFFGGNSGSSCTITGTVIPDIVFSNSASGGSSPGRGGGGGASFSNGGNGGDHPPSDPQGPHYDCAGKPGVLGGGGGGATRQNSYNMLGGNGGEGAVFLFY